MRSKTVAGKRLFWFLKEGTSIDLSKPSYRDLYIQQVLTTGDTRDIKKLFREVKLADFIDSFNRLKKFLPEEVRKFWDETLGDLNKSSKENTYFI